jgi:hypothetical protein
MGTLSKELRWCGKVGSTAKYATARIHRFVTPKIWISTLKVVAVLAVCLIS